MNIVKNFGNQLQSLRKSKGLSQEKLADISGLHRTYISSLERGSRNPTLTTMYAIASAFKIDLAELLSGVNNE